MQIMNVIMFISMYPVLLLMYFFLRNCNKINHESLFGVALPSKYGEYEEIQKMQKQYLKLLKRNTLLCTVCSFLVFLIPYVSVVISVWMLWTFGMIFAVEYPYAKMNRVLKKWKKEQNITYGAQEDSHWIWGSVYYDKTGPTMVSKRDGTGTTVNLAKPVGVVLTGFVALCMLAMIPLCVWIIRLEFTPMKLSYEAGVLVADQTKVEYEIPVEEITNLEFLEEVPRMSKSSGTGMDTYCQGTFFIRNVGKCQVFLNPKNHAFLCFTTEDGTMYYMSAATDEETNEIYRQLEQDVT